MSLATLMVACVFRRHRRGQRAAAARLHDVDIATDKVPCFEMRIYVEDDDLSCDFTMRVEYAELGSRELLLECIARAAFEATEISFDFNSACLELLEHKGGLPTVVRTDADCKRVRGAAGLRITTGGRPAGVSRAARTAAPRVGSLLHDADDDTTTELIL